LGHSMQRVSNDKLLETGNSIISILAPNTLDG